MTDADLFAALCETTVVGSAAILMVLALRLPLRNAFGAGIAHSAWALVPLAMLAVLLPAAQVPVLAIPVIAMPAGVSSLVVDDVPHASIDGAFAAHRCRLRHARFGALDDRPATSLHARAG